MTNAVTANPAFDLTTLTRYYPLLESLSVNNHMACFVIPLFLTPVACRSTTRNDVTAMTAIHSYYGISYHCYSILISRTLRIRGEAFKKSDLKLQNSTHPIKHYSHLRPNWYPKRASKKEFWSVTVNVE